jgi:hypothetical protein
MKVLLDENIDVRFKKLFINTIHEVYTVRDMEWNGIKNRDNIVGRTTLLTTTITSTGTSLLHTTYGPEPDCNIFLPQH